MESKYAIYNGLTNILYINMWGEAQRSNDIVYIKGVDDSIESKLCIRLAFTVAQINATRIGLDCGIFQYIKILVKFNCLFKNKYFLRVKGTNKGHTKNEWLLDISNAQELPSSIWYEVWEYLN